MSRAATAPLCREIARSIPARPFAVEFWDGQALPSTTGAGPVFSVRSPRAVAHALRAPGQLGLGRAYVSGDLALDDLDAVMALLDGWQPPPIDARAPG
jgi:cyclopropane-fatty-acyl-phospholipid synthase